MSKPIARPPVALIVASFADSVMSFRGALVEALGEKGLEVHICAPFETAYDGADVEVGRSRATLHRIPVSRGGMNPFSDFLFCLRVARLTWGLKPALVLSYTAKPVIYGTIAAWLCRVPRRFALITGLGYAFQEDSRGWLRAFVEAMYSFSLRRATKTFFQNPDDEALFRQRRIIDAGAASVVVDGSGVDIQRYAAASVPDGPPSFLMIARLLGAKGVREYIAAARQVRARYPEASFELAGWIDDTPDAVSKSELEGWLAEGHVRFLGRLQDVRPAFERCSVYVLPSYREGTPRTVLEALAMGRAVITTNVPGCRETVVDGDNGILVQARDPNALAEAMIAFVQDPRMAIRMAGRSRQLAESRYDVGKVNARMLREMDVDGIVRRSELPDE